MKRLKDILLVLLRIKMVILFIQGTKGSESNNEPLNHQGKSFLLGFLEMDIDSGTSAIYVTSSAPSEINITVRYLNKTITRHTRPGVSTRIELPTTIRMKGLALENKGILLTANTTVSVYATNVRKLRRKSSRDVYVIFPTSTLGSQHVITTYTPITKSLAGIIALRDNTLVQIKLRLQGNITYMNKVYQNGDILRIFLNRLQTFQLQYTKDLTGTFVVATGPVVVLGGNICAMVPTQKTGCSHLCTQLVPVSKWGTRFMTSPIVRKRGEDYFKIVAGFDNTTISIHGKMNLILSAGQHHEFNLGRTEPRYIECSMPVMLMQFNKGSSGYIQSEPFALMVPPIQQYTNSYNLPIPVQYERPPFSNRISFIANTSDFRSIVFDTPTFCKNNLTQFSIPETNFTVYSCELRNIDVSTVIPIRHTSAGGRIATYVVGHTDNDGYGYLGGMEMRDVNCLRLFPDGLTMDNGCDGRIDKDMANITSCDPMLSIVQVPLSKSEYLNGSEVSYNITQNCEGLITRIYNYKTPNGTKVIVAKQEIRWKKRRPTINLPTQTRVNESNISSLEIAVRNMSSLCPGDTLKFNDSSSVRENGTEIIQRLWIVREACGRVTTATQTIIVHSTGTDGEKCGVKKSRMMLLVILITSVGIPLIILVSAACIMLAWKKHVSRQLRISVRHIDVNEANAKGLCYSNAHTIENHSYSQIEKGDVNHNSSKEQSKLPPRPSEDTH